MSMEGKWKNETSTLLYLPANDSLTENGDPPQFRALDYGEIALLAILIMVGGPLNLISLIRTLRSVGYFQQCSSRVKIPLATYTQSTRLRISGTSTRGGNLKPDSRSKGFASKTSPMLLTFKLHLTSANLFIVFGYGLSQLGWLCTYSWNGGDALCKFTKFLHTFCFYSTSNLVASIAIDRVNVTANLDRPTQSTGRRVSRIPIFASAFSPQAGWIQRLVWGAWILAFASSIPQFFIWRTFEPFPDWCQCVTVWLAESYAEEKQGTVEDFAFYARIYDAIHLALVFWIPASVIVFCYAIVLGQLHKRIRKSNQDARKQSRFRRESDGANVRQKWEDMHRASICSTGSLGEKEAIGQNIGSQQSPGLLMELPIVMSSAEPFLCSTKVITRSFAVVTLRKAKRNVMKKTAWILLAYVACWSPYQTLELYRYLFDPEFDNVYLQFLSNLIVFNAVVNPVIY